MSKKDIKYVWVIEQDWKGGFKPKKVTKEEAKGVNIKQFATEDKAWDAISDINIEPDH